MDKVKTSAYDQETWKQLLGKIKDAGETENKEAKSFMEQVNTIMDHNRTHTETKASRPDNLYKV